MNGVVPVRQQPVGTGPGGSSCVGWRRHSLRHFPTGPASRCVASLSMSLAKTKSTSRDRNLILAERLDFQPKAAGEAIAEAFSVRTKELTRRRLVDVQFELDVIDSLR